MSGNESSCDAPLAKSGTVEYRPIPHFSGYLAASDGSVWRDTPDGILRIRILVNHRGYSTVTIFDDQGFHRIVKCGVLVLLAFVGTRPRGWEACHKDGNRQNDAIGNLRWGTKESNERDKDMHNTRCRGETHGSTKLRDDQVVQIRIRRKAGESPKALAEEYGVTSPTITNICQGKIRKRKTNGEPMEL